MYKFLNSATNLIDTSQLLGLDNSNYGFGSSATNLEYSILSNMLGSPQQFLDNNSNSSPNSSWSAKQQPQDTLSSTPTSTYTTNTVNLGDPILFSPTLQQQQQQQQQANIFNPSSQQQQQQQIAIAKMENSPKSTSSTLLTTLTNKRIRRHDSTNGYANASKPFSYAEGYHYLINYVRQK
jgi:hypothetical protein